jgi:hypothetical protein
LSLAICGGTSSQFDAGIARARSIGGRARFPGDSDLRVDIHRADEHVSPPAPSRAIRWVRAQTDLATSCSFS